MNDHLKIVLNAVIDSSSLSDVKKQIAKERLQIPVEIQVEDISKTTSDMEKQLASIGTLLKSLDTTSLSQSIQSILELKEAVTACGEALTELTKFSQESNGIMQYFDAAAESADRYSASVRTAASATSDLSVSTPPAPKIPMTPSQDSGITSSISSYGEAFDTFHATTTQMETALNSLETSLQSMSVSFQKLIDSAFGSSASNKIISFESAASTSINSVVRLASDKTARAASDSIQNIPSIFKNLDFPAQKVKGYLKVA